MSRDVTQRCERVRARFQAANNLACHGAYSSQLRAQRIVAHTHSDPQRCENPCAKIFGWAKTAVELGRRRLANNRSINTEILQLIYK